MQFYSSDSQTLHPNLSMLPQKGSGSGGSNRPLNSYAVLRDGHSIVLDAPYSWTRHGWQALVDGGHPPRALVLSHRNVAGSADALPALINEFAVPVLLHRADADHPEADGLMAADPMRGGGARLLAEAGIEPIALPGHTAGSVLLWLAEERILLAGDCAVGPGPAQEDQTPRLERPLGADTDPAFVDGWKRVMAERDVAAIYPLHGLGYSRADHGAAFDEIVANIWNGAPMDPHPDG